MHTAMKLFSCSILLAAPFAYIPVTHVQAATPIVVAQGVTGAPVGGSTGTGGNAGAGDHDAGADKADTYENPANPMNATTTGKNHRHAHRPSSDSTTTVPRSNRSGINSTPPAGTPGSD